MSGVIVQVQSAQDRFAQSAGADQCRQRGRAVCAELPRWFRFRPGSNARRPVEKSFEVARFYTLIQGQADNFWSGAIVKDILPRPVAVLRTIGRSP